MEDYADWIGKPVTRDDVVTPRLLAQYRSTLGPWLFDRSPDLAPPGCHWGLAPATPALAETAPDGSEAQGQCFPPIPFPRRMWAGGRVETFSGIRLGASIRRVSTIADVHYREGKSGRLYFVSVRHDIEAGGALAVRERQDLVFREAQSQASPGVAAAPPGDALAWTVHASSLLLFRFSAFTFNGHRIHYDDEFCREEGYPAPLVHGPLQAALMLNQLSAKLGEVPRHFDYRCLSPLPAGADFIVRTEAGLVTRVVRHDGVITAEGRIPAQDT